MRTIISFLLFLTALNISGQEMNHELKTELDSIMYKDQELRKLFSSIMEDEKKAILKDFGYTWEEFDEQGWEIVKKQDSINIDRVSEIISRYGYPGKSLVGEPTNKAAWFVIQHSNKIEEYFPLIRKAGKENEIPLTLVAMMEDRLLMYKGEKQKYGTQMKSGIITDPETGERKWQFYIWPVESPEQVNELRKSVGFETTIEEYARSSNVEYKELSLEDVQK
ncbi:hypothetical protein NE848_10730 [Gramella jeungdoensis]|uniref:Uncharacterized protein n=1 Tax=Gramella jeungdoensis TaxID=708091 RepID=A0ABT0Z2A6_9FLAO|nr:DUF6624 domain-containing protein [Gramella jeungdoensis]MCM8569857.1 hypothetical protein [Gramella jeungdoensis]